MATVYIERLYHPLKFHSNSVDTNVNKTCYYKAADKFFFSLGVLTFTTHYKQLCAMAMCSIFQVQIAKMWRCFSTPKHPLVYGLVLLQPILPHKKNRLCATDSHASTSTQQSDESR